MKNLRNSHRVKHWVEPRNERTKKQSFCYKQLERFSGYHFWQLQKCSNQITKKTVSRPTPKSQEAKIITDSTAVAFTIVVINLLNSFISWMGQMMKRRGAIVQQQRGEDTTTRLWTKWSMPTARASNIW